MSNTLAQVKAFKKNSLTSQQQTFYNINNYSAKPFGYQLINYKNLLKLDGKNFDPFEFTATDRKVYTVESYSESPWQRDTEQRVKSNTSPNGHFNFLNVMSRYVDCTLYIGPSTKVEGEHEIKTNTLVFNDAHARMLAAKLHIAGKAFNKDCILNVPEEWILLITITGDIDDLKNNYDANDSKKASKTKRHSVQSILRALNYVAHLKSDFIKQGNFASSIDIAVPVKKSSPSNIQDLELLDQIKLLKTPIEIVDKEFSTITRPKSDKPNVLQQHQILGIVLMLLQNTAYGNDPKLLKAMERLIINDEDKVDSKQDGIFVLCNLFEGNSSHYDKLQKKVGGLYTSYKPELNGKMNNVSNLLPLAKGMTYFERTEGPNLVVFLINHYLTTNGSSIDFDKVNWKNDISGKYNNLVNYVYNGGTTI